MIGELLFLTQYHLIAIVQRISSCDEVQNTVLTPDNLVNVLMYGSQPASVISGRFKNR